MVVTDQHFIPEPPDWVTDPEVDRELKRMFMEDFGLGKEASWADHMFIDSKCFICEQVLEIPYIYWDGLGKGISFHPQCGQRFIAGIYRDIEKSNTNPETE